MATYEIITREIFSNTDLRTEFATTRFADVLSWWNHNNTTTRVMNVALDIDGERLTYNLNGAMHSTLDRHDSITLTALRETCEMER